jgi:hypothetical protein
VALHAAGGHTISDVAGSSTPERATKAMNCAADISKAIWHSCSKSAVRCR